MENRITFSALRRLGRHLFLLIFLCSLYPVLSHGQYKDSLPYPIYDRQGDLFLYPSRNPFNLQDTSLLFRKVEYDSATGLYNVYEKLGDSYYRLPTSLSLEQLIQLYGKENEKNFFQEKAAALDVLNHKQTRPKPTIYDSFFNRTFGVTKSGKLVDIRPQGNLDLKVGYQGQYVNNPTLSENARRTGGFDMNANINFNMNAEIGSKLTLPVSWNTQSTFDFENQLKLRYTGFDDEIIKSIEAGNLSFQTKGRLMTSMQNLFGVKTQLQFGKLFLTAAMATSKSQKQSIAVQGGGVSQSISKTLDDYDENRNFLLAQYFKNRFNYNMAKLPLSRSQVNITRMEVWVTNRTGATTNARNVVGLSDLGESSPYNATVNVTGSGDLPNNDINDLYGKLNNSSAARDGSLAVSYLQAQGLVAVQDYEKVYARKLTEGSDYVYNPKIGFISLSSTLQSDDVLAVAYQYTYNGRTYQVGEFSSDVALDSASGVQKVIFLKLLKATAQRVKLPLWQLMMKNVYSLGVTGIDSSSLRLGVYYQESGGGTKRYLPESSPATQGQSIVSIVNADRLNTSGSPLPDGNFDYINGYTVLPTQGKIIFPVLEPFGHDLDSLAYDGVDPTISAKYVFSPLYDTIKSIAQTYANLDRYVLMGTARGSSSSSISLGAVNITQGSVTVTAGGQTLVENVDYTVDYSSGTLQIINESIA